MYLNKNKFQRLSKVWIIKWMNFWTALWMFSVDWIVQSSPDWNKELRRKISEGKEEELKKIRRWRDQGIVREDILQIVGFISVIILGAHRLYLNIKICLYFGLMMLTIDNCPETALKLLWTKCGGRGCPKRLRRAGTLGKLGTINFF